MGHSVLSLLLVCCGIISIAVASTLVRKSTGGGPLSRYPFIGATQECLPPNSCYIFTKSGKSWAENQKSCSSINGFLVSMETEAEWKFINDQIQKLTTRGMDTMNEWHIGLRQEGDEWQWVNGHPLTIDKWQRNRPNNDGTFGLMAKNYPPGSKGLFDDVRNDVHRAFICEITFVIQEACSETTCYRFYKAGKTWTENRNSCKKEGVDLVSLETEAERRFVNNQVQKINLPGFTPSEWHIGLEKVGTWLGEGDEPDSPHFIWVSGTDPFFNLKWQSGQPSDDGDYVVMSKDSQGFFKVLPNDERRPYICELPKVIKEACSGTTCYRFYRAGKTWTENRNSCKKEGGDLVSLETETERRFVNNQVQKINLPDFTSIEWHIGLEKVGTWLGEGDEPDSPHFIWVSGTDPLFNLKWQSGQPSDDGDYVVMSKDSQGFFKVLPNDEHRPYICELPKASDAIE